MTSTFDFISDRPDPDFSPETPIPNPKKLRAFTALDSAKAIWGMMRNPMNTLSAYQFSLPVFQYRVFSSHFTAISDPALIRHCFVDNASNYALEPIRQAILTPVLRGGMVAVEGTPWKKSRKVLAPIFTPRHTRTLAQGMYDTVQQHLHRIFDQREPVAISDLMSDMAYQILSETLFSGELADDSARMMADVATFFHCLGNVDPLDMLQMPKWLPRMSRLGGMRAVKRLRRRIRQLTEARLARQSAGENLPDDFLTRLIDAMDADNAALSAADIEDHILTFIAAGHETTARSLAWLLYLLAHAPDWKAKMVAEIDLLDVGGTDPADWPALLPITSACFDEAMRLFPPAPFITRMAKEDDRFGLAFIPGGSNLFLNLYALHRHETLWELPDLFKPERFLGEAKDRIERFQYLPFGVGHRTCIGAAFAVQEAMIILVNLLRAYDFDYAVDTPPWPVMRITLKPDNGIPMTLRRR